MTMAQPNATAIVNVDIEAFDPQGKRITGADVGEIRREIDLVYVSSAWKIEAYSVPVDDFVKRLTSATTSEELQAILQSTQDWDAGVMSASLRKAGAPAGDQKDYKEANRIAAIVCVMGTARQDADILGSCYFVLGDIDARQSPEAAVRDYDQAKAQFRLAQDVTGEMAAALNAAKADRAANRPDDFLQELHDAEQLRGKTDKPLMSAMLLLYIADAYEQAHYMREGREYLQQSARIAESVDSQEGKHLAAEAHLRLGDLLMENLGDETDNLLYAIDEYQRAYDLAAAVGDETEGPGADGALATAATLVRHAAHRCVRQREFAPCICRSVPGSAGGFSAGVARRGRPAGAADWASDAARRCVSVYGRFRRGAQVVQKARKCRFPTRFLCDCACRR